LNEEKNPTLKFAKECGMELHFVSREEYKKKDASTPLSMTAENYYLLPEGGTNELAVKGCAEIISFIKIPFDFICCPVGTGGTIAGIISSLKEDQKAIGFSVLRGESFLENDIRSFIGEKNNWELNHNYYFGKYAKHSPELLKFISDFEKENNISLEQVYTGKMMFGIYDLIKKDFFPKNSTVIAIHTGGLQGKLKPQP
jgi:1-aminocyclopropane-1-carboxylate deaminase